MAQSEGGDAADLDPEAVSGRTVPGIFLRQAARLGTRAMVTHHDGTRWRQLSWAEGRESVLRIAARLAGLGVGPGDRVLLLSENRLAWVLCDLAVQSAGAVTVPLHPGSSRASMAAVVKDSGATIAIVSGPALAARLEPKGALAHVATMDSDLPGWTSEPASEEQAAEVRRRLEALRPDDVATIAYTSGTTGEPKGAVLPQRCFADMARSSLQVFDIGEGDVSLSLLPFSHILERMDGIVIGIAAGATMTVGRGLGSAAEDLQQIRPTVMVGVPRMYEKIHEAVLDRAARLDPARRALLVWAVATGRAHARAGRPGPWLRFRHAAASALVLRRLHRHITGGRLRFFVSGGAPLSAEVESFFWAIGVRVLQGWGLTETTSGATSNTEREHRFETVGRPLPGVEVRLAGDGEILVRGPGLMTAYHNLPQESSQALAEDWLHTGDVGVLDADGFLTVTDRKKDLIKTAGGKYVAPQPLEARLERDRVIRRAIVVGDGRPYVVALVVPDWEVLAARGLAGEPGELVADPRVAALVQAPVDALNRELAAFETIKRVGLLRLDFTEEAGEMTPTLKMRRKLIQARYASQIDALYAAPREPRETGTSRGGPAL